MLVDSDTLRAFADQVQIASTAINETAVGHCVSTAADGLEGSTTQWAARQVGNHVTSIAETITQSVSKMGVSVRGAGDKYEVEDSDLARSFDGIF
ncbi:hypothetical protein [Mycolicibacterium smegmatis]|uniref:Uncharacterized protein n=1 Tax=Mycolicibacterium smegmatis (strain ATCC 700084 / mc(2)155) TaxID=246196 RepID=A0QQQ7_MYCS2|nr:hypothetical protein [Mycolicibacterium smegmatis]ABK74079.1 hypothetical protein MSMEG_0842 [Mycolicibacterium smegmatis MC2 155]AIU06101.1 hypothetical protein LJ00_04185 [Mycolicibacterium smegmatis MC2 155]AIU12726.1 hypothetical protein LI99_04185 [Mycolicibacterium smegmatis]AIU19350.1 hypothetical protein LI98_04185 [Mycolicibacterium smegmatis]MBE9618170.1 hypothetical protein [Mycolicibacterium smegmatis]